MALLKPLNGKDRYHNADAREKLTHYMFNPCKAESGYVGGVHVDPNDIAGSMKRVVDHYHQDKPRTVQLRHFVLAFPPEELDEPAIVCEIAQDIARYIGEDYQTIFSVHEDTQNLHAHIMFNSVSYRDGHRYRGTKKEHYDLLRETKEVLHCYGINRLITVKARSDIDVQNASYTDCGDK